jgi:hypothetical protein
MRQSLNEFHGSVNCPNFSMFRGHLGWWFLSETFGLDLGTEYKPQQSFVEISRSPLLPA